MSEYATQWVCTDCIILLANGDISDGAEDPGALLSKFEGFRAMPGMPREEHAETCSYRVTGEEWCQDCETNNYSTLSCDGCGSPYHGERFAVTIEATFPVHADYPHEPGTLYDCPACKAVCYCAPEATQCVCCAIEEDSIAHSAAV